MTYYNKGQPEVRDGFPLPPYNSPSNPNYATFANQPQFPLDNGSNAYQIQQNREALSYFVGLNQQVSDTVAANTANNTRIPYPTFKTQGERLLYQQGQSIAVAKRIATQNAMLSSSTIYNYINGTK
jgi:hypothetical protein